MAACAPKPTAMESGSSGSAQSAPSAPSASTPGAKSPLPVPSGTLATGTTPAARPPNSAPPPSAPAARSSLPTKDGPVTPEMESLFRRRTGCEYLYFFLDWPAHTKPLGLIIVSHLRRVFVGSVKAGSLAEEKLRALDRVVAVNNCPVSDKEVAKAIIKAANGRFGLLIERPTAEDVRKEFEQAVKDAEPSVSSAPPPSPAPPAHPALPAPVSSTPAPAVPSTPSPAAATPTTPSAKPPVTPPPSPIDVAEAPALSVLAPPPALSKTAIAVPINIRVPSDVQLILDRHIAERKAPGFTTKLVKPIIKGKTPLRTNSKCNVVESGQEVPIPSDLDPGKKLRKVNQPKPKPSTPAKTPPPAASPAPPAPTKPS